MLEELQKYWGCGPVRTIGRISAELMNHLDYYQRFRNIDHLIEAVYQRVVYRKIWSNQKRGYVPCQ